jgi:hypothetical protein
LLHFDAVTSVGVLARFDNPYVFPRFARVTLLLLFLVVTLKFGELGVVMAQLDVESQGKSIEDVLALTTIGVIVAHVDK